MNIIRCFDNQYDAESEALSLLGERPGHCGIEDCCGPLLHSTWEEVNELTFDLLGYTPRPVKSTEKGK